MDDHDKFGRQYTLGAIPPETPAPSQPVHGTIGPLPTVGAPAGTRDTDDWTGAQLKGRYAVVGPLGVGGMGVVYLANDCDLGDHVVVKRPHAHLLADRAVPARFLQEVRSLIRLRHPHICHVRDAGEHQGVPFVVMDYLSGGSLLERGSREADGNASFMAVEQVLAWLSDVAKALDFIHSQGHVHRDVKPGNILFDAHGNAYLTDLGIIKAIVRDERARALTLEGSFIGTPEYTAPEVFAAEEYDGRADQYSLAAVVYELLGGRRPFEGPTPFAIVRKQATTMPAGLHALNRAVSEGVSQAVLKALSSLPDDRYPTCLAFLQALAQQTIAGGRSSAAETGRVSQQGARARQLSVLAAQILGPGATLVAQLRRQGGALAGQIARRS